MIFVPIYAIMSLRWNKNSHRVLYDARKMHSIFWTFSQYQWHFFNILHEKTGKILTFALILWSYRVCWRYTAPRTQSNIHCHQTFLLKIIISLACESQTVSIQNLLPLMFLNQPVKFMICSCSYLIYSRHLWSIIETKYTDIL